MGFAALKCAAVSIKCAFRFLGRSMPLRLFFLTCFHSACAQSLPSLVMPSAAPFVVCWVSQAETAYVIVTVASGRSIPSSMSVVLHHCSNYSPETGRQGQPHPGVCDD